MLHGKTPFFFKEGGGKLTYMVCACRYFCIAAAVVVAAGLRRKRKVPLCANRWGLELIFQIKSNEGEKAIP